MRQIQAKEITNAVKELCLKAACDLPHDVEEKIREGYEKEVSKYGRYSLEKVLENVEFARDEMLPMCQDTGIVVVFVEVGRGVEVQEGSLEDAIQEGVRQGYEEGYLRKSIVTDPIFQRKNTMDNTPAMIYTRMVEGDSVKLTVMPKGAGSENMSALKMLKPSDGVEGLKSFVLESVEQAGGNPCPPIIVGIGVGGTMEAAALQSKRALLREVGQSHPEVNYADLEQELYEEINKLGIGPQGFGGKVTCLGVHIEYLPTHMATLPVAISMNCHAARHKEVVL